MKRKHGDPMSEAQRNVRNMIVSYRKRHGYSPSFREIAEYRGINSTNAVKELLVALVEKGWLRMTPGVARTLVPVEPSR